MGVTFPGMMFANCQSFPMYLPVGLKKHDICGKRYVIALKTAFLIASTSLVLVEVAALTQE